MYRLKLRCDRAIPCSSCVKRGCGAICPDVGSFFVLYIQSLTDLLSGISDDWPRKSVGSFLLCGVRAYIFFFESFVLASTQELHEKISELATRVRELEDALRTS